jgi:hypothetical protein
MSCKVWRMFRKVFLKSYLTLVQIAGGLEGIFIMCFESTVSPLWCMDVGNRFHAVGNECCAVHCWLVMCNFMYLSKYDSIIGKINKGRENCRLGSSDRSGVMYFMLARHVCIVPVTGLWCVGLPKHACAVQWFFVTVGSTSGWRSQFHTCCCENVKSDVTCPA